MIAEPSAAEGDVAVFIVDIEPMDLPTEQEGEDQVGELVGEGHHPADILADAGDDETHKEDDDADEADSEIFVKPDSAEAGSF